jgi:peroxiredoxin
MSVMKSLCVLCSCLLCLAGVDAADQNLTPVPGRHAAPDFELQDTEGERHRLSDYRGQPVLINFWATWCPPCREEIPSMNRAWARIAEEGIVMLAINVGEDEDTIFVFTADYPADFPVLLDRDGEVIAQWPVKGLPTTYIVDPEGRIAYRAIGGREWDDEQLLDVLRALQK